MSGQGGWRGSLKAIEIMAASFWIRWRGEAQLHRTVLWIAGVNLESMEPRDQWAHLAYLVLQAPQDHREL
ncbi:hypothetical protein Celaphus_00017194 [Cervus elaphus hippelaphus]|uniref:Uncharacterized protein n=1 Tax=Cervus elaphus hippelaphus TaxID=46360 RepID=A0A212CMS6_CEREH|nr:hypothetical protein Celaphus_00017194 [Cervus elaphus hippelaphus]